MSGTGSELVDSFPVDRLVAFDTLVRSEPYDEDEEEEDEEDDGEDEDEGNSDGYSE